MEELTLQSSTNPKKDLTKKEAFNYFLPENLIAQTPVYPRDSSRLLVLNRKAGNLIHKNFSDIAGYLNSGDLLVLNNSKVLPARIYGKNIESGKSIEFLLLSEVSKNTWKTLCKPGKKVIIGSKFQFSDGLLECIVKDITETGERIVVFDDTSNFYEKLEKIGQMPLPPYIKEKLSDPERYQTVYASNLGSSAAPTAGLHFTSQLIDKLKNKGVNIEFITLHVGLGTFRPVKEEDILNHKMHSEYFCISEKTANIVNETKKNGKRVVCVGTTTCRALESVASSDGKISRFSGQTDIFIYPGYEFKVVDSIITNFHLPESTLIMLVSAFAGYENTMKAYENAVENKYRFFSFGDSMLII